MGNFKQTDERIYDANRVQDTSKILIMQKGNARNRWFNFEDTYEIKWSKYQIKESDRRQKTATFSSPNHLDLTTGQYAVLITSPFHDDFGGLILSIEYNEDTGMYDYQCQDNTRYYMGKTTLIAGGDLPVYNFIRSLITGWDVGLNPTPEQLNNYKNTLSGLLPQVAYEQSKYGSTTKYNPMDNVYKMWVKDKRTFEVIQDIIYGTGAYIDVYCNKYGILQIEPYNKDEWENTGLHLAPYEYPDHKLKFDTTDIITGVRVYNNKPEGSDVYMTSKDLIGLDLSVFFGIVTGAVGVHEEKTATSTTTTSANTNNGNPYNSKAKKIWINSDNGSDGFKKSIISILQGKGWTVKDGGTCSNCHYSGYGDVTSDYAVYATLYNGFCAGTVKEAYSSSIQNKLKKKGVQLVIMWDSTHWTEGMKPYRYGDFSGYNAKRAWDDNFSSSDPSINNVSDWLKKNNAKYCVSPTPEGVVEQFLAGGYFAYKGIK